MINLIVLVAVVGAFLALARPFDGAMWVGIALFLTGFYMAWRYGKAIRKRNEIKTDYDRYLNK